MVTAIALITCIVITLAIAYKTGMLKCTNKCTNTETPCPPECHKEN